MRSDHGFWFVYLAITESVKFSFVPFILLYRSISLFHISTHGQGISDKDISEKRGVNVGKQEDENDEQGRRRVRVRVMMMVMMMMMMMTKKEGEGGDDGGDEGDDDVNVI